MSSTCTYEDYYKLAVLKDRKTRIDLLTLIANYKDKIFNICVNIFDDVFNINITNIDDIKHGKLLFFTYTFKFCNEQFFHKFFEENISAFLYSSNFTVLTKKGPGTNTYDDDNNELFHFNFNIYFVLNEKYRCKDSYLYRIPVDLI